MSEQDAPTREEVMNRRFELDAEIEELNRQHKVKVGPLAEELTMCEQFIKAEMANGNEQQYKLANGHQCFFVTKDSVTVEDMGKVIHYALAAAPLPEEVSDPNVWDSIINHIARSGMWEILNKAVNKTTAKEILESSPAALAGAVKYSSFRDLSWRRGKSA